jgi:hypothetical protein
LNQRTLSFSILVIKVFPKLGLKFKPKRHYRSVTALSVEKFPES